MKKTINLTTNLNGLQLNLISIQEQLKLEKQRSLISEHAEKNVEDLEVISEQLKTQIQNFKK